MNAANYLGHNNWQLPTTPLSDPNCGKVGPGGGGNFGFGCTAAALASMYNALGLNAPNTAVPIPNNSTGPFHNVQPYLYWSQTTFSASQGNSAFSFASGFVGANTLPNVLYLWPAIAGRLPGMPAENGKGLQVSPDGLTVYDPQNDVTWAANANLAATNRFGVPLCTNPTTPALCVVADGSMTWASAEQFLANMNSAAYLGQTNWIAPAITGCTNYNCGGTANPMGNLYYQQLHLTQGSPAAPAPKVAVGPFQNLQPYLYWSCLGQTVPSPCESQGPIVNQEWSYSFGSGFEGTDILVNSLYATAYYVGPANTAPPSPALTPGSLANGATYAPGGLVPGSWAQVKGTNLSSTSRIWKASDFVGLGNNLPVKLDGVQVLVNSIPAAVYFIDPAQINFQIPNGITGTASVQVTYNGQASNTVTAQAASSAPGIFQIIVNGVNYAAGVFLDGKIVGDPAVSSGYRKAKPGDVIELYATGLVATPAGIVPSEQTVSGVTVTIGSVAIPADFAGLVAVGEFQINFTVPQQIADGTYPISIQVNGTSSPSTIDSNPPGPIVLPIQH